MPKHLNLLVILLIICLMLVFPFLGEEMTKKEQLPVLKLTLGDSFAQMQSQSSYQFDFKSLEHFQPLVIGKPFIFEYTHIKHGFSLPPGLFGAFTTYAGHVVSADLGPHLRYLTLSEMLILLEELKNLFESSGWQLQRTYSSLAEIEQIFTESKGVGHQDILGFKEWSSQGEEIYIELTRRWKAGQAPPLVVGPHVDHNQDLFTIKVSIDNNQVWEKYAG